MKVYFNTKTFDDLIRNSNMDVTHEENTAEILVLGAKKIDYAKFPRLRAVYRFGVGCDNVDFEYLKQRDIPVFFPSVHTKNILYEATANFTVYGILNFFYRHAFGDVTTWTKTKRDFIGRKKALVIGTGNIGRFVIEKLKVFMEVKTFDSVDNDPDELKGLMRDVDAVTVHIPLNETTVSFFDKEKLSWIKDGALIVNTARGTLFDEEALFLKLKNSNCHAFFDVFWKEPYDGKLKDLGPDKFFMTPHSASNTKEFIKAGFDEILDLIRKVADE